MNAKITINLIRQLSGHRQGLYGLAGKDHGSFYSCGGDGLLVQWWPLESDQGKLIANLDEPVYSMAFDTGIGVLCGTQSGILVVLDPDFNARKLEKHKGGIFHISVLENENFITCGGDGKVVLWNKQLEILQEKQLSQKSIRCAVHIDNGWAFGSSDSDIYITDSEFRVRQILRGHKESVFALEYVNGKLISGGRDALIHIWDIPEGRQELPVQAHWFHVNDLKLNAENSILASASMDKTIKLWYAGNLELMKVLNSEKYGIHKSSVNRLLWLNETVLISASDDREIGVWEIKLE